MTVAAGRSRAQVFGGARRGGCCADQRRVVTKLLRLCGFFAGTFVATSPCFLASVASGSPYSEAVLTDSPVAYYRFEDVASSNGSTMLNSGTSGASINGIYNGSDFSLVGNSFNGGSNSLGNAVDVANLTNVNYIRVPDNNSLDLTTAATLEAWISAPSAAVAANTYARIFDKARSSAYMLFLNASTGQPTVQSGSNQLAYAQDVRGGGWTHVVATFDNTVGWRMYIDGTLVASNANTTTLQTNTAPLDLFKDPMSTTGDRYTGQADEIAIYSTALSPERVLAHYTAASQVAAVPEPSTLLMAAAVASLGGGALFFRRRTTQKRTPPTRRSAL